MYLFNVTLSHAGHDLHITVAADQSSEAIERAERMANKRERINFEAWRVLRVATVH